VRCEVSCKSELSVVDWAFSVRSLSWRDTTLINICDHDLIGKTLVEGKLKMHISKDYFGGQLVGDEEALRMMRASSIVNLAGQRAVEMAISNQLGHKEAVRMVEGVPFLMIYKFTY
jgi:uncharacterized protein